ncbi:gluconate 2-dehydrogenase subunit 3 family protein [Effusibacillus consociatus]|uniref:Gluconate 2-dehydrogenase subunit 3 family protein n=1 Tax=Effusibacillus consociatus TaxID=1117041 RepID=A0ABV9Q710_9BACL
MNPFHTHYPDFDVMDQKEHWDPHTREIVEKRLELGNYKTLSQQEAETLYQLCSVLLHDTRDTILYYVVHHFDNKLSSDIGESQRKKGIPKHSVLIREGLRALDQYCTSDYGALFSGLEDHIQHMIVDQLMRGTLQLNADGVQIPAQDLFSKLLTESVSAYYSHPSIWSEIGYAGPAYPRGYVRSEMGLTDPWEAKRRDA